jgi:hypothetical protein
VYWFEATNTSPQGMGHIGRTREAENLSPTSGVSQDEQVQVQPESSQEIDSGMSSVGNALHSIRNHSKHGSFAVWFAVNWHYLATLIVTWQFYWQL